LIALIPGGTCWISPVRGTIASRTASVETPAALAFAMMVPSASSVPVACPRRIVAR